MNTSLFLAKALGIYLVLVSIPFIFNQRKLQPIVNKLLADEPIMLLSAILALILGIILVLFHNVWTDDWRVVITVLCWLTLIKGVLWLYIPNTLRKAVSFYRTSATYIATGVIMLVIGLFLLYHGFF